MPQARLPRHLSECDMAERNSKSYGHWCTTSFHGLRYGILHLPPPRVRWDGGPADEGAREPRRLLTEDGHNRPQFLTAPIPHLDKTSPGGGLW